MAKERGGGGKKREIVNFLGLLLSRWLFLIFQEEGEGKEKHPVPLTPYLSKKERGEEVTQA